MQHLQFETFGLDDPTEASVVAVDVESKALVILCMNQKSRR